MRKIELPEWCKAVDKLIEKAAKAKGLRPAEFREKILKAENKGAGAAKEEKS